MGLKPISRLDSTRQLHLAFGLPLRNQEACTSLLDQIYDPASPEYHHYLHRACACVILDPDQAEAT